MVSARVARGLAGLALVIAAALGTAGCLLVPAPVPVAGPVIVAPRPYYGHYHRGYYGGGHHGHRRGYWR